MEPAVVTILVCCAALIVVCDAVIHAVAVWRGLPVFEHAPRLEAPRRDPDPDAEPIEFPTADGLTLRGAVYRPACTTPRGVVVFCPEFGANHWSAATYVEGLIEAGFIVCAFDFRNQGESDALPGYFPLHWPTTYERDDCLAAIEWVKSREDLQGLPINLLGISRGGGAALSTAAISRDVAGVATDGAFSVDGLMYIYGLRWTELHIPPAILRWIPRWHVRLSMLLVRWASQWRRGCQYLQLGRDLGRLRAKPTLLITGERDTYVPLEHASALYSRLNGHGEMWVVPGARHNRARQIDPAAYDHRLAAFFAGNAVETTARRVHRPVFVRSPQPNFECATES
ncbi:MAG TPA: alpha/beta fold hydrolase [Planctomycetaceae bacterium]|nr:alpha/beta fold hydrolase [Planctomycetaceae bacterium]